MALAYALARDAATRRRLRLWLRSLGPSFDLRDAELPWLPFRTIEWLERTLRPDMRVFEWGCGGSTHFLARRVREVVSVEHDPDWHRATAAGLARRGIGNCRLRLVEPEPDDRAIPGAAVRWSLEAYAGSSFARYAAAIDEVPDGHLDLVVVDGRHRVACGQRALAKVRPGGHLLLDDSDRARYAPLVRQLEGRPRLDFRGLTPLSVRIRQSTAWRID